MNESGIAKLRGVMRRRKIPVVATMVGVIGVAAALISQLEPGYKASAVIRADEVQPAKEYVPPTVAEQMGERLKSLRLSVMARPLVMQAAQELNVFRAYPRLSPEEIVDNMRSRMDVKLEGEDTFLLTYVDSNPERARAVVNHVAQAFMKQNVERRRQVATATTQALRDEADTLKPQLDAAEKAVRELKMKHYGALPEQQEGNLRTLDQTTMELNIMETNLDLDQERRRALLASAMSPLRHHEETLAGELYEARTKYTDENPEVSKIKSQYDKVRNERLADEKDLLGKLRRNNPELVAIEGEIARTKAMVAGLRERQREVRGRVDATAKNGQELAGLAATYDGLKDKYAATLARLRDAELAEGVEKSLASLRFNLVEDASLPAHASSPNRPLLAAAALLLALAAGLGLGFALDAQDTSIRDAETLRRWAAGPPILAAVPRVPFASKPSGPKAEA
ncbi:MAG TPA: hypothetical protein VFF06_30020 [Polyangia bacterium]|nr:hypothetical protein [Polyangia bacterium]